MARTTKPLTNTEIKNAKAREKEFNLTDGEGLMLRVKPNGTKCWILNYYHPSTGKRKNYSIGIYPSVSLSDARKARGELKVLVVKGIDPKEYKDERKRQTQIETSLTLVKVALDWFNVKKTKISESTAISLWRNFENHVFPKLGHRPISKLSAPEVIATLKPLAGKGSLETTSKIIGHINEVMTFAVNTGVILHNPLSGIRAAFQSPKAVNLPTLKPSELPELMGKISYAQIKLTTRCLIEWQLHTMVRPSEAAGALWDEIDLDNMLWVISAERMKMKKSHTVPLTKQAVAILERMRHVSGHRLHVFPSDRAPNKPSNSSTANMALKRMGFKGRLVAHGMRALASTTLNEKGFNGDLIEAALAHVDSNEVRRAYNRSEYLERRRELMEWWSNHIVESQGAALQ